MLRIARARDTCSLRNGVGNTKAVVVIGVLAEQVDASWRLGVAGGYGRTHFERASRLKIHSHVLQLARLVLRQRVHRENPAAISVPPRYFELLGSAIRRIELGMQMRFGMWLAVSRRLVPRHEIRKRALQSPSYLSSTVLSAALDQPLIARER